VTSSSSTLRFSLPACSAVAAAVLLTISAPSFAADPAVVLIGHAAPLTGQLSHMGKDSENAARLAIDEINSQHPVIGGKPVRFQLDSQDDAADPRTGTQVAQKLVDDGVVAVVGDINSGVSIPASKIYSEAGIVQISQGSTNPAYTLQGYKTAFRVVATDALQGPALAHYALDSLHAKRIAIVDDSTAYGQGLADEFEKAAKAKDSTIVTREATNDKATDFRDPDEDQGSASRRHHVRRLGRDCGTIGQASGKSRDNSEGAGRGDGACTDKMIDLAGDAIGNVTCSEAGLALSKMPKGQDFEKRYMARFKTPIDAYAPFTYDAVYVIYNAMKRADSTERTKILAAMPSTQYDGVIGRIAFDPHGDLKDAAITIYEFKDKKKTVMDVIKM